MKKYTMLFWVTTGIIFLGEGVIPALTSQTQLAVDGITSLGYPAYFGVMLTVFKVIGALVLIIPAIPKRVKEWAYAGFAIDFIGAFVSLVAVNGFGAEATLPLIAAALLVLSYVARYKLGKSA